MRRPIHQLRQYWYNEPDGTMQGDRIHQLDTYQEPQEPEACAPPAGLPPIVININLGNILAGLGLDQLVAKARASTGVTERLEEGTLPRIPKRTLIEAVSRGADPAEVADLMRALSSRGLLA